MNLAIANPTAAGRIILARLLPLPLRFRLRFLGAAAFLRLRGAAAFFVLRLRGAAALRLRGAAALRLRGAALRFAFLRFAII